VRGWVGLVAVLPFLLVLLTGVAGAERERSTTTRQNPKVRDAAIKKAKAADEARESIEAERDGLKSAIQSLEREVAAAKQVGLGVVGLGWASAVDFG